MTLNAPEKLFFFWLAYEEEAKLLQQWHLSTAQKRRGANLSAPPHTTGNILFDSFCDTWGDSHFVNNLPMDRKSWFSALGTVSSGLRKECFDLLEKILVTVAWPLALKVSEAVAEEKAKTKIDSIMEDLKREKRSLAELDEKMNSLRGDNPGDEYLEALQQLMRLETRCFQTQIHFLESGEIQSPSVSPSV